MKNIISEVVFKTSVRDDKVTGENQYKWKDQTIDDYFKSIRVIMFSLPRIFTLICLTYELPNFEKLFNDFKSLSKKLKFKKCISNG